MSKTPPIPREQRSFQGQGRDREDSHLERRDAKTGLQSGHGDDDVNLAQQGRQANTRQNLTPQWKTQER